MVQFNVLTSTLKAHTFGVYCAKSVLQAADEFVATIDLVLEFLVRFPSRMRWNLRSDQLEFPFQSAQHINYRPARCEQREAAGKLD